MLSYDKHVVDHYGPEAVTNLPLEDLLDEEGLSTLRARQERFNFLQLFDMEPFKTPTETLLVKNVGHLATHVTTEVPLTEAPLDHPEPPSQLTEKATCTRCPRQAIAQVIDSYSQQASLACGTHAQDIHKELPGSTLRRLVPLSRIPSASGCIQALLLHLFTQASTVPCIAERIELARSLFSSLSRGDVPKLAVPVTRAEILQTVNVGLEIWKDSPVASLLFTRLYGFILGHASLTNRSLCNYAPRQRVVNRHCSERPSSKHPGEDSAKEVPLENSTNHMALERAARTLLSGSSATTECMGVDLTIGDSITVAGPCVIVHGKSCETPIQVSSQDVSIQSCRPTTGRFAVLIAVESMAAVTSWGEHHREMEEMAGKEVAPLGFTGVDLVLIASGGFPTRLFKIIMSKILTALCQQWNGNVMVAHRCDTGKGEAPGSSTATSGHHISAQILRSVDPILKTFGIHVYRAFDHPHFSGDAHVDQVPDLAGSHKGKNLFPVYFAAELARQV